MGKKWLSGRRRQTVNLLVNLALVRIQLFSFIKEEFNIKRKRIYNIKHFWKKNYLLYNYNLKAPLYIRSNLYRSLERLSFSLIEKSEYSRLNLIKLRKDLHSLKRWVYVFQKVGTLL